jgi:hypothetical protein
MRYAIFIALIFSVSLAQADFLCFSPVKENKGDKNTKRSFWQSFDYKVQVDDGPIIVPSKNEGTMYETSSKSPLVKIYLGGKITESFRVKPEWLKEGRNCIYFKNLYETWSVVEKWQADKLCKCNE